ncbi:MFS transporter [Desulfoluna spongiiphila]|uniref:MFS transporter n=1 Tax=Desulfoluna spongiiphila TaxID=419481 RepID=UPI001256511A|nr:MFS transporter [Desulfoluna spongiiphila]VVS94119.1 mfs transporter superfamily [Desulfoluna spongiiphila]
MHAAPTRSPFSLRNVRLFIAFRLFFTARFYYPVFSILFLDFGLTVSQFALLNAVWAAVIVVAEVPSGALADTLGRKRLLVATGAMMVVELSLLCVAPIRGGGLLFTLFLVNRVLSGLAEASASGADEALAYDALKREGMEGAWGRVLEVQMRVQSVAFVVAMVLGGVVYDPEVMGRFFSFLGLGISVTQDLTLRIPLVLTFVFGLFTLGCALAMSEPADPAHAEQPSTAEAFAKTLEAGRWILTTSFALTVILAGLIFDGVMRMVITLASQYYRVIGIPEASFGLIGALVAALGIVVPKVSRHLAETRSPRFNLMVLGSLTLVSLVWMAFFPPYLGLVPALVLFGAMSMVAFFVSHYLNRLAASETRATVLSFKGLAYNISYGLLGMLYAVILAMERRPLLAETPLLSGQGLEDRLFMETFFVFPLSFALLMAFFLLFVLGKRDKNEPRNPSPS